MHSKIEFDQTAQLSTAAAPRQILVFHKLTTRLTYGSTNYSPERFVRLLDSLMDRAFTLVSLDEAVAGGDSKKIAITFDDGYAHLMPVLPSLLEKFNLQPTVFISTAFIGRNNSWDYSSIFKSERHLEKSQIRELASLGVRFGSHGHRHIGLSGCAPKLLKDELTESKEILENIVNVPVDALSYPFGRFNTAVASIVKDAGYHYAFTMKFPEKSDDNFSLGRIPVYCFDTPACLRQKLNGRLSRKIHRAADRFINRLSTGTLFFNRWTGRNKNFQ